MTNQSRRDFLKMTTTGLLTASGLLGLGGLMRFLSFSTEAPPKTEFDLGPAADFPADSQTVLTDVPAVLEHTEDGFSALSLVCSHLGCTVAEGQDGFVCPCHGSRFNAQGAVERGPAKQGLRPLRVETTSDDQLQLFLDA